jgi:hypothetical protein
MKKILKGLNTKFNLTTIKLYLYNIMEVLLINISKNNESYQNFSKYCIDHHLITNKIIINESLTTLNSYFNKFLEYDYIIYIDDRYKFDKHFKLINYIEILNKNNYHQIFFTKNKSKKNKIYNGIIEPIFENYNFCTKKHLESSLTILENSNELNAKNRNITGINYSNYIDNDEINWPFFNLKPSLIKSNVFSELQINELSILYPDRKFSLNYSKKFKSCYHKNSVSILKSTIQKKGDPEDMTIVTGFINIPDNGKNKTHCKKKHTYSYKEKSIPTLKIKQKMVIYVSQYLYEHVYNIRKSINYLDKTKIIIIDNTFLYMKEHIEKIRKNCEKNCKIYKNPYYISAVSTRYNLMRDAIKNNFFSTNYFTWIDFAVSHSIIISENTLFCYNDYKFRISWIARYNKNKSFQFNHYVLGGGIFGGHKDIVKLVSDLHDEVFIDNMNLGYNCNDDKTLWFIFERYPELFDTYFSGYISIAARYGK